MEQLSKGLVTQRPRGKADNGQENGNAKAIVYDVIHKAGKIRGKESPRIRVKFILASHSRKSDIMQQ